MYLPTIHTVTRAYISDDGIDEGDIFLARPTVGRPIRQSCRIGHDIVTLAFESHIVLHHAIAIGSTMYGDDESGGIRTTITRWYVEDIAPSFSCYCDFMRSRCQSSRIHTSLGEVGEWRLFCIVFSDSEYEFRCLASCHRRTHGVTRRVEDIVRICEFLIGEIPWIPVRRREVIEPESHRESLQYCHRIVRLELTIVESPHHSEPHSLTDIRMIPLGHCDVRKTSLLSALWTHSLSSK